ncbi:hypothetical protein Tco_0077400 [Tanacetum coccineum]
MEECHRMLMDQVDLVNPEGHQLVPDDLEYLVSGDKGRKSALSISKLKATQYLDFRLEELVPSLWIESEREYDISVVYDISHYVVSLKTLERYGYAYLKEIVLRRADYKEYKISEVDFKKIYIQMILKISTCFIFKMFIKSRFYLDDEYVDMTRNKFLQYTRLDIPEFRDTLIQHMESVKKSIGERAQHKMEYERRVNERQIQQQGKARYVMALDAFEMLVHKSLKASGTESKEYSLKYRYIILSYRGRTQSLVAKKKDISENRASRNFDLMIMPRSSMFKRRLITADQASVFIGMMSVHISSGLVLHQMTSDHNRSELGIPRHSTTVSSKAVPKLFPLAVKTATSRQSEELLPPKKRICSSSSSLTTLSNSSRNQTCDLVSPSSSVYTPTPPQIFEIGKCPIKMYLKHHEGQIEDILNYLDELYLHHIEKMKEGRIDRMIIRRNNDELKTELKKIRTQIIKLQKKRLGQKDKIAFAHYRISDLERIIEKIQARHQTDQEDL